VNAKIQRFNWALLIAILTGCGGERAEREPDAEHEAGEVQLFEKNKGVRLPSELRRELGLVTVEVAEKSVTPRMEKIARVYRAATGETPAAAVAWLNEAEAQEARGGQNVALLSTGRPLHYLQSSRREEAHSAAPATGTLVRLVKSSGVAPGQVEALIEFNDAEGQFPVGSSLPVDFSAERARPALVVPESAVIRGAAGAFVYAVNGEHFIRTPVKLGVVTDGGVEITDGLYAGDVIVAKAVDSLWLVELCALKGGTPCCPVPPKKHDH